MFYKSINWKPKKILEIFFLSVCISVGLCVWYQVPVFFFFDASHWPSDHMINSRRLIALVNPCSLPYSPHQIAPGEGPHVGSVWLVDWWIVDQLVEPKKQKVIPY